MAPNVDIIVTCVKLTTLVITERTFLSKADLKGYHFVLFPHVQVSDVRSSSAYYFTLLVMYFVKISIEPSGQNIVV